MMHWRSLATDRRHHSATKRRFGLNWRDGGKKPWKNALLKQLMEEFECAEAVPHLFFQSARRHLFSFSRDVITMSAMRKTFETRTTEFL
jgi:hypothetical protein